LLTKFAAYPFGILLAFCAIVRDPEEPTRPWRDFLDNIGDQREVAYSAIRNSRSSVALLKSVPANIVPSLLIFSLERLPVRDKI
jgi:hypothetical protein